MVVAKMLCRIVASGLVIATLLAVSSVASAQSDKKFATVTAKKASIYAKAEESSPVKATAKRGDFLEFGGMQGAWIRVRNSSGVVGYIMKSNVVPGKKELGAGGGGGGGDPSGGHLPRGGGGGPGPTVEGRTGLLSKFGLQFAANSYGFKASTGSGDVNRSVGMKTPYSGINAEADYWFIAMAGAHIRFASAFGSMSTELSAPVSKKVDRIPTNINRIEVDGEGRFFLGDSAAAPSLNARLGFHIHEMRIDPIVDGNGQPLYLVSNSYKGLALGLGADVPLGGPAFGLHAGATYWLAPSITEGKSGASGKAKGASGIGFGAGTYFNFSDTSGMDIGLEYASFSSTFSGSGERFNYTVSNSKTTDSYLLFGVNGTYRF